MSGGAPNLVRAPAAAIYNGPMRKAPLALALVLVLVGACAPSPAPAPPPGPAASAPPATASAPHVPASAPSSTAAASASAAPPATGAASTPGPAAAPGACAKDADCTLFSDYCGGCFCRSLAPGQAQPKCPGRPVACLVDPCGHQRAACEAGKCALREASGRSGS